MYRLASLVFIAFFLFVSCTDAQFSKGMRMPGITIGSAFFNSGKTEFTSPAPTTGFTSNSNSIGIDLVPSMGWFITDRVVVGGRLITGYEYEKIIDDDNNVTFRKGVTNSFRGGLGGFARNYFHNAGSFLPFAQVNIDAGISTAKSTGFRYLTAYKETYSGKSSGGMFASAGISVGMTKMITDHAGLDFSAGYTFTHSKIKNTTSTRRDVGNDGSIDETIIDEVTNKATNHGFAIAVGFQIFLGKK